MPRSMPPFVARRRTCGIFAPYSCYICPPTNKDRWEGQKWSARQKKSHRDLWPIPKTEIEQVIAMGVSTPRRRKNARPPCLLSVRRGPPNRASDSCSARRWSAPWSTGIGAVRHGKNAASQRRYGGPKEPDPDNPPQGWVTHAIICSRL